MRKAIFAVVGVLLGLPIGAVAGASLFCSLWGTGSHMDGCGLAGLFLGLWPGGIAGFLGGWWLGSWLEPR